MLASDSDRKDMLNMTENEQIVRRTMNPTRHLSANFCLGHQAANAEMPVCRPVWVGLCARSLEIEDKKLMAPKRMIWVKIGIRRHRPIKLFGKKTNCKGDCLEARAETPKKANTGRYDKTYSEACFTGVSVKKNARNFLKNRAHTTM